MIPRSLFGTRPVLWKFSLHSPSTRFCGKLWPPSSNTSRLLQRDLRLGSRASFHSTPPRRDVFFFAFPTLKAHLLSITRVTLVVLPFVWRYRLWKRYPRTSFVLLQIPVFAVCLAFALGLDQCPRTQRWRLLLMSEREELDWARQRFNECVQEDGPLLIYTPDPRVLQVQRVTERLIEALEDDSSPGHIVSAATAVWPPEEFEKTELVPVKESLEATYKPSATAFSSLMPYKPESSNPTKIFACQDWKLYIVDSPRINAFALPTREIFVYTGLIDLLEDDTLLSGVLAHEIAHVTQRHASEKAGWLNVAAIAFDFLRGISYAMTISFPMVTDATGSVLNWLNNYVAERAFSRKLEMEADAVGLEFMARAGYDPRLAIDLWDIMAAVEEEAAATGEAVTISDRFQLLRTHPTSLQRQRNIEKLLPRAMTAYSQAVSKRAARTPAPSASGPADTPVQPPVSGDSLRN